jgi:ATP-dependent DNA ligase
VSAPRLTFIRPLAPSASPRPPQGDDWLHEPKWDGFRFQIINDGSDVRFYSKSGAEYGDRLPGVREACWEQCLRSGKAQRPIFHAPRRVRSNPHTSGLER